MADQIEVEREREYGDAWLYTGKVLTLFPDRLISRLLRKKLLFPWLMILNKTIRILWSPGKIDHWKDIEGYARLARSHAEMPTDENQPKNQTGS